MKLAGLMPHSKETKIWKKTDNNSVESDFDDENLVCA